VNSEGGNSETRAPKHEAGRSPIPTASTLPMHEKIQACQTAIEAAKSRNNEKIRNMNDE
jgi:hypothetical protein